MERNVTQRNEERGGRKKKEAQRGRGRRRGVKSKHTKQGQQSKMVFEQEGGIFTLRPSCLSSTLIGNRSHVLDLFLLLSTNGMRLPVPARSSSSC
jgi:hypothetical protein